MVYILQCNNKQRRSSKKMDQFLHDDVDKYLCHDQSQYQILRKHSMSLEQSHDPMPTYKTKINAEINKGSTTINNLDKIKDHPHNLQSVGGNYIEQGYSALSLSKKERNRISAKQSRDRKKLYIQLMQYEHKKLQKQLQNVEDQILEVKGKINRFCTSHKATVGFAARDQLQGKLAKILSDTKSENLQQQLNIVVDSISFRIGATGRQRIQKQNQYYKQFINLCLPAVNRYLIWASSANAHIFNSNNNKMQQNQQFPYPLVENIFQDMQNSEQVFSMLSKMKNQIIEKKQSIVQLVAKLWKTKGNIQVVTKQLEHLIDSTRQILSPTQAAKFILFASKNKYRNNLNFCRQDKSSNQQYKISQQIKEIREQQQEIQQLSKPTKKVKRSVQW